MELETRVVLLEKGQESIMAALQDYKDLKETVALLKQSVELLHKTVWAILATVGGAMVIIVFNIIFKGAM